MRFCALTSGSSGNCYYVENEKYALLVDAGLSAKKIFQLLDHADCKTNKIKAILLTHEHTDHVKGVDVMARQLNIPVFATAKTFESFIFQKDKLAKVINNDEEFKIAGFNVRAVPKNHSASDPVSFMIENKKKKVSFMTDLGKVCKESAEAINESDFIFLESNHDIKMLEDGPYLPFHKKWVLSDKGHLSNMQAALAMLEHGKQEVRGIALSHISRTNNTSHLAEKTFRNIMKERSKFNPEVFVSEKEIPTKMFEL